MGTEREGWGDRWAVWNTRGAGKDGARVLHPMPDLPMGGDPDRAEAWITGDLWQDPAAQSFGWLSDLAARGDETAGRFAATALAHWTGRWGQGAAWTPEVTGRRLLHWIAHARFAHPRGVPLASLDALSHQAAYLARRWQAGGLTALAGLAVAGHALERPALRPDDIARALRPVALRPDAMPDALTALLAIRLCWPDAPTGPFLADLVPALRAARHPDGRLTRLWGGAGGDPCQIDAALALASLRAPPSAATNPRRLARGGTTVILRTDAPLPFEMSSGRHPVIIATPEGLATPQIRDTPLRRPPARGVEGDAYTLRAVHSGWKGLTHRRRLTLSPDGTTLTGQDVFEGRGRATRHISVHFPLAPDLTVTEDENGLHLRLPSGTVWTFDAPDTPVLATHPPRIVIYRAVDRLPARLDWTLTRTAATPLATEHQTKGEVA